MAGYTKLFNSILASTIWRAPDKTRLVWITLLAMADKRGIAEGSIPGLADMARVSIEDCEKALDELQQPDRYSRSTEYAGRRIEPIDGGWRLLNHGKYRQKLNADERREYLRQKQAEYRASKQASTTVNNVSDKYTLLTQPTPDTEATPKATTTTNAPSLIVSPNRYDKLKATHAFVGSRLRVPNVLHDELRTKCGSNGDAKLQGWYLILNEQAETSGEAIPDVFTWLRPRFVAWCQSEGFVKDAPTPGFAAKTGADIMAEAAAIREARKARR